MNASGVKRRVSIDFCDFWPGFRKTDNFFYKLLRERFDVEICDRPDFLIYADPGQHVHRLHNCVKIYLCAEEFPPDFSQCDYAFTCHYLADPRHLRLPFYMPYVGRGQLDKSQEDLAKLLASKTKFCSFIVSNVHPRKTQKRIDFFHRLSKYKRVDSGGTGLNNMGGPIAPGTPAKREFLRAYKFNITFENGSTPGYTTEKIVDSMVSRAMPIYWGNPRIAEEFNPKSFLNYIDFPSEDALIEKIIELDRDDAKYMEYLREPYFHNNTPNEFCSRERVLNQFEKIFTTPIVPVSAKAGRRRPGRWVAAKMNQAHPLSFD